MSGGGHRPFDEADVRAEFADALRAGGFRLKGAPAMDGAWHCAVVEGDKGAQKSGRYRGYLAGIRPAGFIENFRDPLGTGSWKSDAVVALVAEQYLEAFGATPPAGGLQ